MTLDAFCGAWNRFWFEPRSPVPLACYRILFGVLVLCCAALLAPDWMTWFGEKGVLSHETVQAIMGPNPRLSVFAVLPYNDANVAALLPALVVAALCLTVGFFTRTSAAAVAIIIYSLVQCDPYPFNGGDQLMRLVALILCVSPAGAALSFDRLWRIARGKETGPPPDCAPWAQRLLQIQVATAYLTTAVLKCDGTYWVDGTATYYTARLEDFARLPVPYVFDHLWTIHLTTWGTVLLEFALGLLVWFRDIRYIVLLGGVMLHLGIEWSMYIPLFPALMITTYVTFLEHEHLAGAAIRVREGARRLFSGPPHADGAVVFFDGDCTFCLRTARLLHALDIFGLHRGVDFRAPGATAAWSGFDVDRAEREMLLHTPDGRWLSGFEAFRWLAWRLPVLAPVAPLLHVPPIAWLGRRVYAWVAEHRFLVMGRHCATDSCLLPRAS